MTQQSPSGLTGLRPRPPSQCPTAASNPDTPIPMTSCMTPFSRRNHQYQTRGRDTGAMVQAWPFVTQHSVRSHVANSAKCLMPKERSRSWSPSFSPSLTGSPPFSTQSPGTALTLPSFRISPSATLAAHDGSSVVPAHTRQARHMTNTHRCWGEFSLAQKRSCLRLSYTGW